MLKMVIKFKDEINEEYYLEEVYDYLNSFATRRNLTVCEDGVYTDSGNSHDDMYSFMLIASVLSKQEWMKYASEWSWYENDDVPQNLLETFKILE